MRSLCNHRSHGHKAGPLQEKSIPRIQSLCSSVPHLGSNCFSTTGCCGPLAQVPLVPHCAPGISCDFSPSLGSLSFPRLQCLHLPPPPNVPHTSLLPGSYPRSRHCCPHPTFSALSQLPTPGATSCRCSLKQYLNLPPDCGP